MSEPYPSGSGFSSTYLPGHLTPFSQLQISGRSIQGNQPSPASMAWVPEELGTQS